MPSGAQQMGRGRGASLITSLRWIYLFFFFFDVFVPKHPPPPGKVHGTEIKQSWLMSPKGQLSPRAIHPPPDLCRSSAGAERPARPHAAPG